MKRVVLLLLLVGCISPNFNLPSGASFVSDKVYAAAQKKEYKRELKNIKELIAIQGILANKHDIEALKPLYTDNYVNNDGFNKELYFKNVKETWDECKDLTYETEILSVEINGDNASVYVSEISTGTVFETSEDIAVAGEIHSKSTGIYHLNKIGGKWFISGETLLTDESSLLYGDARFMNIELQSPYQVGAGETYTTTLKIDADDKTFTIASIGSDPVTYPSSLPSGPLRAMPKSNVLERVLTANKDNINEYAVASLAISKTSGETLEDYKMYMAGLACLMRRINVVSVNNFLKSEDKI